MMLAMETGLSRTTVNNWFINARRRYVKPLMQGRLVLQSGVFKTVSNDNCNTTTTGGGGGASSSSASSPPSPISNTVNNSNACFGSSQYMSANPSVSYKSSYTHSPISEKGHRERSGSRRGGGGGGGANSGFSSNVNSNTTSNMNSSPSPLQFSNSYNPCSLSSNNDTPNSSCHMNSSFISNVFSAQQNNLSLGKPSDSAAAISAMAVAAAAAAAVYAGANMSTNRGTSSSSSSSSPSVSASISGSLSSALSPTSSLLFSSQFSNLLNTAANSSTNMNRTSRTASIHHLHPSLQHHSQHSDNLLSNEHLVDGITNLSKSLLCSTASEQERIIGGSGD
ncbi:unnamed protein product [Heterobilharzia americana]|nr:unnamed protein product [Heterobilharzia americana]